MNIEELQVDTHTFPSSVLKRTGPKLIVKAKQSLRYPSLSCAFVLHSVEGMNSIWQIKIDLLSNLARVRSQSSLEGSLKWLV